MTDEQLHSTYPRYQFGRINGVLQSRIIEFAEQEDPDVWKESPRDVPDAVAEIPAADPEPVAPEPEPADGAAPIAANPTSPAKKTKKTKTA